MDDERFMREALHAALRASDHDDVPVGCVLVAGDAVLSVGENRREIDNDPTAHAEIVALREAAKANEMIERAEVTGKIVLLCQQ